MVVLLKVSQLLVSGRLSSSAVSADWRECHGQSVDMPLSELGLNLFFMSRLRPEGIVGGLKAAAAVGVGPELAAVQQVEVPDSELCAA